MAKTPAHSGLFAVDERIIAYTDGGSRGNPGPAALGVVIGQKEYGEYLGIRTNNYAEYMAVVFALKKIKQLIGKEKAKQADVEVRADSELVVKQLNHQYKIENEDLQPLFFQVWNLMLDYGSVRFVHVFREQNKDADRMVNNALDSQGRK